MDINDLTPELREKAANCNTPDELLALAKAAGYELSDEQIESIAGGSDWSCDDDTCTRYKPLPNY